MGLVSQSPILIFGTGTFGRDTAQALLSRGYNVIGFISNLKPFEEINGLKVYKWDQLSAHSDTQLLIGILNPNDALSFFYQQATEFGFKKIFMPWDFIGYVEQEMGWRFWLKPKDFLLQYKQSLEHVLPLLSDGLSRDCLLNVFNYRSGQNLDYSRFNHSVNHYFNELTLNSKKQIFGYLDIGAYHGENLLELEGLLPVNMAMMFEPDTSNFAQLLSNKLDFRTKRVHLLPLGVSESNSLLSFNSAGSESSGLSAHGSDEVLCVRLDDVVPLSEKIDLLKMDVEGAEIAVLKGAKNVITTHRPTLAISLYHNWNDLWEIPEYVSKAHPEYKLYVRQHMNNSFDLVLYAIPQ
ncbi:FkbM family methyltransferase [Alphaproteobacteria bacterium]|nr:FkbM family methyltransferase [Alphaproteobacteria bacterium]